MDDEHISLESTPKNIQFVTMANEFMKEAREYARLHSLDKTVPTGAVVVKSGVIVGRGANGSNYHDTHVCERVRLKVPTGQGYELCEGCHPKNHAEPRSITDAISQGKDIAGADLYLWGHWWCCRWCYESMMNAGIKTIYLLKNSHKLFDKNKKGNIIGRQFEKAEK